MITASGQAWRVPWIGKGGSMRPSDACDVKGGPSFLASGFSPRARYEVVVPRASTFLRRRLAVAALGVPS